MKLGNLSLRRFLIIMANSMKTLEQPPSFNDLIAAAEAGDWVRVNVHLAEAVARDSAAIEWATNVGLDSPVENLRDLASSVFGETQGPLAPEVARKLALLMNEDAGRYVQFRAACALWIHGDGSPAVRAKLEEFVEDEDPEVSGIAKEHLSPEQS